jgi:hypothetical protein
MHSSRKRLTVEETIAELYSDPNRGIPKDLEEEARAEARTVIF